MDETTIPPTTETPTPCTDCQTYLDGWKRAQADYANLKREIDRERLVAREAASEHLLHQLLPAIDQFEMAMQFAPDATSWQPEQRQVYDTWLIGMKAVQQIWMKSLQDLGLQQVSVMGPFDPTKHEVLAEEEHPDLPTGHICRVIQSGWSWKDRLLRPAKVIVSK